MMRLTLSLVSLTVLISACGPPPESSSPTEAGAPADGADRVTIRANGGPKPGEDEVQAEWDLKIAMFEERHPGIRVEVTDWEYDPQGFVARTMSGDLETVTNTWATEGFRMIQEGLAADITDLVEAQPWCDEIDAQVASPFVRDGRWYALPYYAYSMALAVNRAAFEEAGLVNADGSPQVPQTWEEFRETARRLSDPDAGRYGFAMQAENPQGGWMFLNWGWQAGGEYEVLDNRGAWQAAFASEAVAEGFRFVQALRWEDRVMPPSTMTRQNDVWQMFAAGQVAMTMEPAARHFFDEMRDVYGFDLSDIVFAPLPAGPAGRAHQVGADFLMISAQASEAERRAAFEWIAWHLDPEWIEARSALRAARGRVVGYPQVPLLHGEWGAQIAAAIEGHRTLARQTAYEEGIAGSLHPEPPVACQALYREVLTPTLQAVLGDAETEPLAMLEQFAPTFQAQHLDPFNRQMQSP